MYTCIFSKFVILPDEKILYIRGDHITSIQQIGKNLCITLINGNSYEVTETFESLRNKVGENEIFDGLFRP